MKPFRPGKADRSEGGEQEEPGKERHHPGETPVVRDLARMPPVVDHADEEEEGAGREAVVHHLYDPALQALGSEGEDAENDEAEVTDGRVRHKSFQVRLHGRHDRAVDDPDDRQAGHPRGEVDRCLRKQRQVEAEEPVGAELQEYGGQEHGRGRRRLGVGVGKPGVKREQGHLYGEGRAEREEQPRLGAGRQLEVQQLPVIERDALPANGEEDDPGQEQPRAEGRVEDELDRRVDAPLTSPHADEQVHRDERQLEEHEEENQVEAEEHAEKAGLEHEHRNHVHLHVGADRNRGRQ